MKEIAKKEIENMIFEVRGKYVMLASDIAKLYGMETKNINKTVRRNIDKFSREDYFQLTVDEVKENECSRFQVGTLNETKNGRGSNLKYMPYVFTNKGIEIVDMLLKSNNIKKITKLILEVFDEESMLQNKLEAPNLEPKRVIENMIYEINGIQIMLDFDLAKLYQVNTKRINEEVKNNPEKFPERFSWILSDEKSKSFLVEIFDQKK